MRWTVLLLLFFSFNQLVYAENNPFAKHTSLNISKDVKWRIAEGGATKTKSDDNGLFYHLMYDAKQLRLSISTDQLARQPKKFTQFEVIDVLVDNKRLALFNWCLNNQSEHSRYLQQGLSVKNDVCVVDGNRGQLTLWLDAATVKIISSSRALVFVIKPYRTSLSLQYTLADFPMMQAALVKQSAPPVIAVKKEPLIRSCWTVLPKNNKTIKAIKYNCGDVVAKKEAEAVVAKQLANERAQVKKQKQQAQALALKQKQQAKERQLQNKARLAKELEAERVVQAQQQAADAKRLLEAEQVADIAAKQSELGVEVTMTMVAMCQKYWDKGEHRCYCQKFIEHAPEAIQANSRCE